MKAEHLNRIIKDKKINIEHYDKVAAFVNDAFTYVIVSFFQSEIVGGVHHRCNEKIVRLSVASIQKRFEYPDDYETQSVSIREVLNRR